MATKKASPPTLSRRIQQDLTEAASMLEEGQPEEARQLLEELDHRHPGLVPVLELLSDACYDLKDISAYEWVIYRLLKVDHDNSDAHLALAGAHVSNLRPALAIHTLEYFLRRWPRHQQAGEAQQLLEKLQTGLRSEAEPLQLSEAEALELGYQGDEVRFFMDHNQYTQARRAAEKLIKRYPEFTPALNNLSQIHALQGELQPAIDLINRVLESLPHNVHALSNLARLLFLSGHPEAASEAAARLKRSPDEAVDAFAKKAEALSFLEDDAGILELYQQARAQGDLELADPSGLFRQALKTNPGMRLARQQLDDLGQPADQRHGAYAFPLANWVPDATIRQLERSLQPAIRRKREADIQNAAQVFLDQHPELLFLAPHMLKRSDEQACDFVISLAGLSEHPVLLQAVRDFALGQRGSSNQRMSAAQLASQRDLLPSGLVRFWSGDEWREVMLLGFEITEEPHATHLSPKAQKLFEEAHNFLLEGDGARAQVLLEKVLALEPDDPSVHNNLALALEMQGQTEEAQAMLRALHAHFPDYLFGVCGVARLEIAAGNSEHARQLLEPLLQRQRLHLTEFSAFCTAQIELCLAEKNENAARSWLEMWERVDDENPQLYPYRLRLNKGLPDKLTRRLLGR
jgi:tetratricopeptide (TPR) repeat protein